MISANNRALQILWNALPEPIRRESELSEIRINLGRAFGGASLTPTWVGEGFPRDLENALAGTKGDPRLIYVARLFSTGALAEMNKRNLSWADETGRLRIAQPPVYVESVQTSRLTEPSRPADWTPAIAAVAETLLVDRLTATERSDHSVLPRTLEIARSSGRSGAVVTRALQHFDNEGYTVKSGGQRGSTAQRSLIAPDAMLSGWAAWYRGYRRKTYLYHGLFAQPVEFARDVLPQALGTRPWAVTGWVASSLIAPYTTQTPTLAVYVDGEWTEPELNRAMAAVDARPVTNGARIKVHIAENHVWNHVTVVNGLPTASRIRVYGDLVRSGSRAQDVAEHLRRFNVEW